MVEALVVDWLQDYNQLNGDDELRTFAASHEFNHEVSVAVFTILSERVKYADLVHSVCNQLHHFYRSQQVELKRFALQFVPTLIHIYLVTVAQGERKNARSIETLLLSIYNCEIMTEDGQPRTMSFQVPVLAKPSIYHEEKTLQGCDLKRWEEYSNKELHWGPFHPVENFNAQNRQKVVTVLMSIYNQQLSLMQKVGLYHLCKTSSQLVNQGFSKPGHAYRSSYGSDPSSGTGPKMPPRIPLSSQFLLELVHAVYFAMFNEFGTVATQAIEDIHHRARFELYTDVIIVTNAIRNSLAANPSGQPSDGPMGISIALSPATTSVVMSKSMITNASFRTKKLPDDIPIQSEDGNPAIALTSINEDGESDPIARNTTTRGSKDGPRIHKIPGLSGLRIKKDKSIDGKHVQNNPNKNGSGPITEQPPMSLSKKLLEKKDKLIGKTSSLSGAGDTIDGEKPSNSPLAILKRKSSSIDVPPTTLITTDIQPANGNNDVLSPTYELADSFDSEDSLVSSNIVQSPNAQVSQV